MTDTEPAGYRLPQATADPLAARLLAAHRTLAAIGDPDKRLRLHLRLMSICTALKMPGANRSRCARRLDRLIADAERAARGNSGRTS